MQARDERGQARVQLARAVRAALPRVPQAVPLHLDLRRQHVMGERAGQKGPCSHPGRSLSAPACRSREKVIPHVQLRGRPLVDEGGQRRAARGDARDATPRSPPGRLQRLAEPELERFAAAGPRLRGVRVVLHHGGGEGVARAEQRRRVQALQHHLVHEVPRQVCAPRQIGTPCDELTRVCVRPTPAHALPCPVCWPPTHRGSELGMRQTPPPLLSRFLPLPAWPGQRRVRSSSG